ncbi:WecB/TagA/CpsF family glycosyltransferase [Acidovorax sp. NCPPB 3859]|nr:MULTISPECIES: WecB/TagA/CpsF family glycosyltransferase [unclassified Acidovorax]MDA8448690.1 WecB/TagA/CpsF family glycosyltransferase [Acidovorax sp. GBBC 3297]MDA8458191.1 WecB/TagA/CpsF family glycosyltransferase [Acidovorax sp. GBBC 3333]MDA8463229.1 WecB/TagA/CpsF family glycosyltransferase [Acidovorax sp. GBBC 3332]MDA8468166.1 WecB/TagA/CpsF family glycosyltransferase [Acidovorax sp. GBBC 3299]WCM79774.1 WecB/TagA/CpsF family glycosyltransferase [Acidovorax sp. GBBC 712]
MTTGSVRLRFFGCPLDLVPPAQLLQRAQAAAEGGERIRIEGLNVAKLVDARTQVPLRAALEEAELVHIDGSGIGIGLRWLGAVPPPRRAGIDLMQDLCDQAARSGAGVFLLGARPEVVSAAAGRLVATCPGLWIAGARDGYFSDADAPRIVEEIRGSGARYLFIGMSSPRKELFLQRYWPALGVALAMGVGGSFDVLSGMLPRAPRWMQRMGMEWLFRLAMEPRRLAGRYLRTNAVFFVLLLRARLIRRHRSQAIKPWDR